MEKVNKSNLSRSEMRGRRGVPDSDLREPTLFPHSLLHVEPLFSFQGNQIIIEKEGKDCQIEELGVKADPLLLREEEETGIQVASGSGCDLRRSSFILSCVSTSDLSQKDLTGECEMQDGVKPAASVSISFPV